MNSYLLIFFLSLSRFSFLSRASPSSSSFAPSSIFLTPWLSLVLSSSRIWSLRLSSIIFKNSDGAGTRDSRLIESLSVDNSFLHTEPTTCIGLWLALEDATTVNVCLWAIPGSHKNGLVRRFLRGEQGVYFDQPSPSYDQNDFVPIEVKAGSLVVIHGDLIHQSFENQSSKSRHAYSLHVVDTDGCTWSQENWIRRKWNRSLCIHLDLI